LLRGVGNGFGPPVFLPLQLPHKVGGVSGFEATSREAQAFADEFELGGEHLLLLYELAQKVVVLAIPGDVGDDAEVVGVVGGVAELLEASGPPNEHAVKPGGQGDRDKTAHGCGVDGFATGTFSRLLVPREAMNTSGVICVKADEASVDPIAILLDVEAGDEVVVADVTLRWRVPSFGDLTEVFFKVGDDILETGNLGGMLRGVGLDRESEAVNELSELLSGDIGMSVEGGEH